MRLPTPQWHQRRPHHLYDRTRAAARRLPVGARRATQLCGTGWPALEVRQLPAQEEPDVAVPAHLCPVGDLKCAGLAAGPVLTMKQECCPAAYSP